MQGSGFLRGKLHFSFASNSLDLRKEGISSVSRVSGMTCSNFCNSAIISSINSDEMLKFLSRDSFSFVLLSFPLLSVVSTGEVCVCINDV